MSMHLQIKYSIKYDITLQHYYICNTVVFNYFQPSNVKVNSQSIFIEQIDFHMVTLKLSFYNNTLDNISRL